MSRFRGDVSLLQSTVCGRMLLSPSIGDMIKGILKSSCFFFSFGVSAFIVVTLINCSLKRHRKPDNNNSFDPVLSYQKRFPAFCRFGTTGKNIFGGGGGGKGAKQTVTRTYFDSSRAELQTTTCLLPRELISLLAAGVRLESLQSVAAVTPTSVNTSGCWPPLCCR